MSFNDLPIKVGALGKTVSGLFLTQTGSLTLQVGTGAVIDSPSGVTSVLSSPQTHTFAPDPVLPTEVRMGLIDDGAGTVDLWVDQYADDGLTRAAPPPAGFTLVLEFAWFAIASSETDLSNATINRRIYL